jgi:hypothetical protein
MSSRSGLCLVAGLALWVFEPRAGLAQLAVQQPVLGVNSVSTSVSVPDRGRAHLGSISRARDSRTHFGPFRPGTSTGFDREHSGLSVGVSIHDFEAMDRYLLSQGTSAPDNPQLTGNARHAWEQLSAGQQPSTRASVPQREPAGKSEKYWQLGQKAEREGNLSVARLHYRIASRYGSEVAKTRLVQWDSSNPSDGVTASPR